MIIFLLKSSLYSLLHETNRMMMIKRVRIIPWLDSNMVARSFVA